MRGGGVPILQLITPLFFYLALRPHTRGRVGGGSHTTTNYTSFFLISDYEEGGRHRQ
jgi:hypothetical protein